MTKFSKKFFGKLVRNEDGASAVEYAILAAIIGVGIVTAATSVKTGIAGAFTKVVTALS